MRRLQAAPQHHVILLNLGGHAMGGDMMRELAEAIAALKALQVLILEGKSPPHLLPRAFVLWRQVHFHTLQGTKSATLVAQHLQGHCYTSRRFKDCLSTVIIFDILRCILQRDVQGFSHAAGNNIGDSGCTALAGALPHLSALQQLYLLSNYFRYFALYFAA